MRYRFLNALISVLRDPPIPEPDDLYWEALAERIMARIRATSRPLLRPIPN
jgi:hypothetical protein